LKYSPPKNAQQKKLYETGCGAERRFAIACAQQKNQAVGLGAKAQKQNTVINVVVSYAMPATGSLL